MIERWRKIKNWTAYAVSSHGQIKRVSPGINTHAGRILKPVKDANGYLMISLCKKGKIQRFTIHRLVLIAFRGAAPKNKTCGRHMNGVRHDNKLRNLRWGSYLDNEKDKLRHGRRLTGSRNANAKLIESDVIEIRRQYWAAKGKRGRIPDGIRAKIAAQFGIQTNSVTDIVNRSWQHT